MKFENLKKLSKGQFRRITGIKSETFNVMVELVKKADNLKKPGRPKKLTVEDRILITLEYLREYRTYSNIGVSYGLSESNTYENIREVENILIKSKCFRLPGKKALLNCKDIFKAVLIDVTESGIERPQKKQGRFYSGKKNATP